MITLTDDEARDILDALHVSLENIELDRLNDDDDEFLDMEEQVAAALELLRVKIEGENHERV